jgi:iron-sulfur cluster assembly protein
MSITLTSRAACELKDLLMAEGKQGARLRVWVAGGGCSGLQYGLGIEEDAPQPDDQIFASEGIEVICDGLSLQYMEGASVDFVEDTLGGGFKIENPNATSSCGCGSSFKTEGGGGGCSSGGCGSCG